MSNRLLLPVFKNGIKSLPTKPGKSRTSVSMLVDGDVKYGEIFFSDKSLIPMKTNSTMAYVPLAGDREYNVAFTNPDTGNWDYEKMTGQQISDANRLYVREKNAGKIAVEDAFQKKFRLGCEMANKEESHVFSDGRGGQMDSSLLSEHITNALDNYEDNEYLFEGDAAGYEFACNAAYSACAIVRVALDRYFGDMNQDERRRVADMAIDVAYGRSCDVLTEDDGRPKELLQFYGRLLEKGHMRFVGDRNDITSSWVAAGPEVEKVAMRSVTNNRRMPDVSCVENESQSEVQMEWFL